jgi:acetyltransferase EpsM
MSGEGEGRAQLIVIGGGEHARVVIEAARSQPERWNVIGFTDRGPCEATATRLGVRHLGEDERCLERFPGSWVVLGIGSVGVSPVRGEIAARFDAQGARWATVVHAGAWVSPSASLGPGTVVVAGAMINACAAIGAQCVVNTAAVVEHDVELGDYTQVSPGAVIGGGVVVGERSYLGLGCRIRDHVTLGRRVTVGMGAVVVGNVADGQVVVGVPARPAGR